MDGADYSLTGGTGFGDVLSGALNLYKIKKGAEVAKEQIRAGLAPSVAGQVASTPAASSTAARTVSQQTSGFNIDPKLIFVGILGLAAVLILPRLVR